MAPAFFPEDSPSRLGVDAGGIAAFLDAADGIELHSLMIVRHGHVIASGWWEPYGPDRPHHLYSLSKSFTSSAAALASAEGLLDLDDPVLRYFPELDGDVTDPRSRAMLVRHIASMSSGHLTDTWDAACGSDPEHPVRAFLRMPPDRDPGTVFAYNQSCTYTLATIVQRVTGQPLTRYLRPRLFDRLGIGSAAWVELPQGQALGFAGLFVTTDAIARLGELYLRGGQWQGLPVLPRDWVAEATRRHIATDYGTNPDWRQGYGFQFWMSRHGYRGDGAFGQFCLVLPEHDAVIAITAGTEDMQELLDAVWRHVLPAFSVEGTAAGSAQADAALAKRLAQLRLPTRDESLPAGHREGSLPDDPIELVPAGGRCEALPALRSVRLDGRNVTLSDGSISMELSVADGWHVTEEPVPAAASGVWTDSGTLELDVIFLETPHRLTLTCSLGDRTFRARWNVPPLAPVVSLSRLRSPMSASDTPKSHSQ
ncbi:MAG TPA: serine hydrolase domain-containing protein [Streptosporangiaceae bacterium]